MIKKSLVAHDLRAALLRPLVGVSLSPGDLCRGRASIGMVLVVA
jgi:hypothetical protein